MNDQEKMGLGIVKQAKRNAKNIRKKFPGQDEGDDYEVNTFGDGTPNIDLDIRKAVNRRADADARFDRQEVDRKRRMQEGQKFSGR